MKQNKESKADRALRALMKRFDFELRGKDVWMRQIGPMPARPFGMTCRGVLDAAERLIPIIREEEYHRGYTSIMEGGAK